MDDTKLDKHPTFYVKPLELIKYINKFVEIKITNGEVITGKVYTVDPVSESFVLLSTKKDSKRLCMHVIGKPSIKSVTIQDTLPESDNLKIDSLFMTNINYSEDEVVKRKEKVKNWLIQNKIPVKEDGDTLTILDMLEIKAPYQLSDCVCSNTIVLSRIQKLLTAM